ncbi:MAG TPA: restriction endonuclease subunit S [Smithellaceae bacterium]|nr:restriction endonuclease subunit S [Smithellaceae bacterium]
MIAALKPYAEYKATEKDWFGVVPKHWGVLPNRALFFEVKDRNHPDEEMLSVTIKRGVVRQKTLLADSSKKDSSNLNKSAYKLVQPADIAYNKMRTWQGAIGVSEFRGIISPAYIVMRLRNKENTPRYFHHLYRTPQFAKEAERWSYGITSDMWSLRPEHFKVIYTPQPSREEQDAIVRFLNWANIRLEKAIRAKRKVIALLNEQKQAIIHRAVTRGLDSSVPLKPSGIPWLGDIPKHWNTPLNQRIFKENIRPHNGKPETQLSLSQRDGLIATKDMQERSLQTASYDNWKVTVPGDLVLNRFKAHLGVFFATTLRGIVSFHYGVFSPLRKLHTKYFELLFHSYPYRAIYAGYSNGMTVGLQNLSNQNFYNVRSIVPTLSEQIAIVEYADRETQMLMTTISCIIREIEHLNEYRTRLVADVVTGKLDVREVVAKLPDEEMPAEVDVSSEDEISDEEIAV